MWYENGCGILRGGNFFSALMNGSSSETSTLFIKFLLLKHFFIHTREGGKAMTFFQVGAVVKEISV